MYTYKANVVRVVDGDTVDMNVDLGFDVWKRLRVRLKGIDTPEIRTKDLEEKERGYAAKNRLIELLESVDYQCILQTFSDKGKYGRWLGTIIIKDNNNFDLDVNQLLINEGLAKEWS